ncbi:CD72 isoform 7 [Pongo abelii]|uniref:CD72 isoform 7 n=1 Tax=Pongo abelii TaxID=9601 RepID=A0A2J8T0F0_PONAB|nr:CD72 isoform 7 [Pongo abelii]
MAEAITYADLRFVKAPLKKSISSRLGQDPGADEDGELTYENVQVPAVPGGPSSLASSVLGDKAAVKSEQPTASWRAVTSPAVGRILPCECLCGAAAGPRARACPGCGWRWAPRGAALSGMSPGAALPTARAAVPH